MSSRTRASSPGGRDLYYRLLYTPGWSHWGFGWRVGFDSVANRYFACPIEIPARCRIDRIGVALRVVISGNIMLGMHDSVGLTPENRVLQTAPIASGALTGNDVFDWVTPTTTPTVNPGLYWLGLICDENYVAATSGISIGGITIDNLNSNAWGDALNSLYRQDVGAFAVPNPMVEVLVSQSFMLWLGVRVTVI